MIIDSYRFGPSGLVGAIMADSPVGYWRLNESSGTSAANQVPGGATGTYSSYATTLHGSGGPYPGGGYISVGQPSGGGQSPGVHLGLTTNYASVCTLMMMVKLSSSQPAAGPHLFSKNNYYAENTFDFPIGLMTDSSLNLHFKLSSDNDFSYDLDLVAPTLSADTWYMVHGVYRANGLCELYVDGSLADSDTISFTIASPFLPWRIGSAGDYSAGTAQSTANADYAEAALFSTALGSDRIAAHFAASGL